MTRIHASDMYAAGTRRSGSGDNPPATLQIKVAIEGYANDPTKLPNAFAATLMPTAKRKSDTTTIPIPTNLKSATKPAFGIFRICNRNILDQEAYHIAPCG